LGWSLISIMLTWFFVSPAWPDGGYVSKTTTTIQSIAVSADQRAIIIKDGDEISMTFSTGYTGECEDFGWTIPTPVPPAIEAVMYKYFPLEIRTGAKCTYGVASTKIRGYGPEREFHPKMGENTLALLQKVGKVGVVIYTVPYALTCILPPLPVPLKSI